MLIAEKRSAPYHQVISWLRCPLNFFWLRSTVMCIWCAQSISNGPGRPVMCDKPLDLAARTHGCGAQLLDDFNLHHEHVNRMHKFLFSLYVFITGVYYYLFMYLVSCKNTKPITITKCRLRFMPLTS